MLWPRARARHVANQELERRLAEARQRTPESQAWVGLLEAALSEDGPAWEAAVPQRPVERPVRAPWLHRSVINVDGRAASRSVRRLLKVAGLTTRGAQRLEAEALLEAAVCQDDARVDALALAAGADPPALRVVAQMAALPLLQACGRRLGGERDVEGAWWVGYCPVCGAWPTLAEFRGLERKRWLRCGRCGTGWEVPWLRCPFCGETSHENLGYLEPDEGHGSRKVEVCDTCKGYVKAESTVRALEPWAVLLEDLTTVPLDVAALDRGYRRPERPGYGLEARVTRR